MVLTRVLGVAGGGVGMAGELSGTVQRQARCVWALRTVNDGSPMKEDATKLDLTLAACARRFSCYGVGGSGEDAFAGADQPCALRGGWGVSEEYVSLGSFIRFALSSRFLQGREKSAICLPWRPSV